MPQVVKLPLAETDLDDLWWYIAQDNPDAADRFLDKIEETMPDTGAIPEYGAFNTSKLRFGGRRGRGLARVLPFFQNR